jgi:hypothetical protein
MLRISRMLAMRATSAAPRDEQDGADLEGRSASCALDVDVFW